MPMFDGTAPIPVNKQAAVALSKAPWWAGVADGVKQQLKEAPLELTLDLTKQPPPGVNNRIGNHYGKLTVIGYSDHKETKRKVKKDRPKPQWWIGPGWDSRPTIHYETDRKRFWWCLCTCGSVERFSHHAMSLAQTHSFGCSWCSTWFRKQCDRDDDYKNHSTLKLESGKLRVLHRDDVCQS